MNALWWALLAAAIVYLIAGPLFDLVAANAPDEEDDK